MKRNLKMTSEEVFELLQPSIKKASSIMAKKYENSYYSDIFNIQEMRALAEDTALEVVRRVMVWNKNKKGEGAVDPKGMYSYFTKAFTNQCLKLYDKHAKTDIRAGIKTTGTDEAMMVAANKNTVNPEDQLILKSEINRVLSELEIIDNRVNALVDSQAKAEGREATTNELQHSSKILTLLLEGFSSEEIANILVLKENEFINHKKAALSLAKELVGESLEAFSEFFSKDLDLRIHTQDVAKRKLITNKRLKLDFKTNYYIQTKFNEGKATTSLFVRIDITGDGKGIKTIDPKLIKIEEETTAEKKSEETRCRLWNKTKSRDFNENIKTIGNKYLNDFMLTIQK